MFLLASETLSNVTAPIESVSDGHTGCLQSHSACVQAERERHRIQNEATVWPVILSAVYYATWGNNAGRPAGWPSGRCVRVCRL